LIIRLATQVSIDTVTRMAKTKTINTRKLVTAPQNCFREENT